jgi:hypothetical protein
MAQVRLIFNEGEANEYIFPLAQAVSDSIPAEKSVVIEGNRADGSIVIPGGKKSVEITIKGIIFDENGYEAIVTKMNEMRSNIDTNVGILSMQHYDGGDWIDDWSYTVKRIGQIDFSDSFRVVDQEYTVRFLILAY